MHIQMLQQQVADNGTGLCNSTLLRILVFASTLVVPCTNIQYPLIDGAKIEPTIEALTRAQGQSMGEVTDTLMGSSRLSTIITDTESTSSVRKRIDC